jgi:hypothetical protein
MIRIEEIERQKRRDKCQVFLIFVNFKILVFFSDFCFIFLFLLTSLQSKYINQTDQTQKSSEQI